MQNNHDFMNSSEMVSMLEQIRRDINADIERRKLAYAYIGKDGKDYYDKESLDMANKAFVETMYKFIGKDGQQYSTTEELQAANKKYEETMFPKIEEQDLSYNNPDIPHKTR